MHVDEGDHDVIAHVLQVLDEGGVDGGGGEEGGVEEGERCEEARGVFLVVIRQGRVLL